MHSHRDIRSHTHTHTNRYIHHINILLRISVKFLEVKPYVAGCLIKVLKKYEQHWGYGNKQLVIQQRSRKVDSMHLI